MSRIANHSRRAFLRGAGGFTLALPFLPSLLPRAAADAGPAPRFVGIMSINGQFETNWFPNMAGEVQVGDDVFEKPMAAFSGPVSNVIGSHFDPVRSKLALLMGLDGLTEGGHNRAFALTGSAHSGGGGATDTAPVFPYSVDTVLERSSAFYPEPAVFGALRVSPSMRRGGNRVPREQSFSWDTVGGVTTRVPYMWDAQVIFDQLFGGATMEDPAAMDPRERQSYVIDRVKEDFDRLRGNARLGGDDRVRLDNYVDHLTDLQTRLARAATISCDGPSLRAYEADMDLIYSNHMDVIVAALACGLTRIATLAVTDCRPDGEEAGFHGNSHGHGPEAEAKSLGFNAWIGQQIAELLTKMDAISEPDGSTLLDSSAVLWTNEISMRSKHDNLSMPVLVAGGACGRLQTGIALDYRQRPEVRWTGRGPALGRPYNQLLTTLMAAMGLGPADWERDGQSGFGDYQNVDNAFASGAWDRYEADRNELLPHYYVG